MPSDLDQRFDNVLAQVTGPGGRLVLGKDEAGRTIVINFPATLPLMFKAFCALYPDREAVVAGDERFLFPEVDMLSDRLALALVARGIVHGDRVAIAMRNCPSWIIAYMAVLKAGGVAVLINGWWQTQELEHAVDLVEPRLIIADLPRAARIGALAGRHELVALDVALPIEAALTPLLSSGGEGLSLPNVAPEDDATILFTSGSTGGAKGALSTHRAVTTATYAYSASLMTLLGLLTGEGRPPPVPRTLVSVPLFHVTGEVPVMLNSFVVGRCMVLMPKWDVAEALRLIEAERVTYFVGVPTMSLELMTHPDRTDYDLSSLTDITAGGAPRPIAHVERLQQEFPNAQPALGYGLTETNATGCSNFWSSYAAKPASTGRPQKPFVEVAILGPGDRHLGVGERGEVAIRTAANITGYWNNPEATAAAITDDLFLRTGDIGYLDEDDYLFIVDRKKDIIIRGGENISAAEVEAACYACSDVAEVSVFGAPDERLGEVPIAIVLPVEGSGLDEAGLRRFLEGRLSAFKIPGRMLFTDEPLPRLGTGKIDRVTLKAKHKD